MKLASIIYIATTYLTSSSLQLKQQGLTNLGNSIGSFIVSFDKPAPLPAINVKDGYFISSSNSSDLVDPMRLSSSAKIFNSFEYDLSNKRFQNGLKDMHEYYMIDLGLVSNNWDTTMYSNYTDIIDDYHGHKNLLGLLLSYKNNNIEVFPFMKAIIRDLKKYMVVNHRRLIPIGVVIDHRFQMDSQSLGFLSCDFNSLNQSYMFDFYLYKVFQEDKETTSIEYSHYELEPVNKTRILLKDNDNQCPLQNNTQWGLHPKNLPHTPRASRCDCLMPMLNYLANHTYLVSNRFTPDDSRIDEVIYNLCDIVYCSSIEMDLSLGHFGMLSTCSKFQKLSIVLNWFFTVYPDLFDLREDPTNSELLRHLILDPEIVVRLPYSYKSEDIGNLYDVTGKSCKQEILGDWSKYTKGRRLSDIQPMIFEEDPVDDELDFKSNRFKNSASNRSLKNLKVNRVTLFLLITSFLVFSII